MSALLDTNDFMVSDWLTNIGLEIKFILLYYILLHLTKFNYTKLN